MSAAGPTSAGRTWGGRSAQDRRAERRLRLLEAGLEIFATESYAGSSISRICAASGVSERYFYEEFGTKAALLTAVYDTIIAEVFEQVTAAHAALAHPSAEALVRSGVRTFAQAVTVDPRKARVNFIEVVGSDPDVEAHRREVLRTFGAFIARLWQEAMAAGAVPARELGGLPMALVGATQELLVDWTADPHHRPLEQAVEELIEVWLVVIGVA